jgi:predicted nuclease of predicted toxin-antitoxin system
MRLKIDENLHDDLAKLLADEGHDVQTVRDEGMSGCEDPVLSQHCRSENRTLVTLDLDFSDIRKYPPEAHAGLIVLRVGNQSRAHVLKVVERILGLLEHETVTGRLWIVTESGVRIRGS